MNDFNRLLAEVIDGYRTGLASEDTLSKLAALSGPDEINRLIEEFDHMDDSQLTDDCGDGMDEHERVRGAISRVLVKIGGKAVDPLVKALDSQNPQTRAYVAATLGKIGVATALTPVLDHLARESSGVAKRGMIRSLGDFGDERAIGPLIEFLMLDPSGDVNAGWLVRLAANALGRIHTDTAQAALAALYENGTHWFVRLGAVEGLRNSSTPKSREILKRAASDPDPRVRRAVADALDSL